MKYLALAIICASSLCFEQLPSTITGKIDWNFYDTASHTILYVRWIDPKTTRNVLVEPDMTERCWRFDGEMLTCE